MADDGETDALVCACHGGDAGEVGGRHGVVGGGGQVRWCHVRGRRADIVKGRKGSVRLGLVGISVYLRSTLLKA